MFRQDKLRHVYEPISRQGHQALTNVKDLSISSLQEARYHGSPVASQELRGFIYDIGYSQELQGRVHVEQVTFVLSERQIVVVLHIQLLQTDVVTQ